MAKQSGKPDRQSDSDVESLKEPALYSLGYVSTQTRPLDNAQMLDILEVAREKNAQLGVTGVLLHRQDSFFQVLEGAKEEVKALFEKISKDFRHERVEVVTEGPIQNREYNDWRMAFIELDGQDFSAMPGFSDLMRNTPAAREFLQTLSRTKKLALLFSVME
ncbi:BLUF domain-containing protein [Congregibacter litoralis]|uniref:Sensors of blue-light using FAD n=1 Tax=Congregibacter litoralis KT71 TaxID=314285 RepID=A4ACN4_9GAMM|nr:BLUF domain-containing protein [Congregibacter litoralis]EAQ96248.2 Sensors of blue-light using FAD [Congregibacter litoralis KT71]